MAKDPWTDPDPQPGDFDESLAELDKSKVEKHPGRADARLTLVNETSGSSPSSEVTAGSIGFWSYVRSDDENSGGRIAELAEHIRREYTLITGEDLRLFVDRKNIEWGQEWKRRIDEELQAVTFLILIITPAYFKSQACRDELLKFSGHASSLGLEELILPVYYVEVPALENYEEGVDPVLDLVHRRQRVEWRELRLKSTSDPAYLEAIAAMAQRLAEIAERAEQPVRELTAEPGGTPVDEELGYLDLLAQGEEALPRWTKTLEDLGAQMQVLAKQGDDGAKQMEAADARGGGFAARLSVARSLARTMDPTAERISDLATAYSEDLVTVDPMILTLVRLARDDEDTRDNPDAKEFFDAVLQIVGGSREAGAQLRTLLEAMEVPSKFSRDLRVPLEKIRTAVRSILDGQAVMDEWERQIESLDTSPSVSET